MTTGAISHILLIISIASSRGQYFSPEIDRQFAPQSPVQNPNAPRPPNLAQYTVIGSFDQIGVSQQQNGVQTSQVQPQVNFQGGQFGGNRFPATNQVSSQPPASVQPTFNGFGQPGVQTIASPGASPPATDFFQPTTPGTQQFQSPTVSTFGQPGSVGTQQPGANFFQPGQQVSPASPNVETPAGPGPQAGSQTVDSFSPQPNFGNQPSAQPQPTVVNQPPPQLQSNIENQIAQQPQLDFGNQPQTQPQQNFVNQPQQPQSNFVNQPPVQPQSNFGNQPQIQPQQNFVNQPQVPQPQSNFDSQFPIQPQPNFGNQPSQQPQINFGNQSPAQPQPNFVNQPPQQQQSNFVNQPPAVQAQPTPFQPNVQPQQQQLQPQPVTQQTVQPAANQPFQPANQDPFQPVNQPLPQQPPQFPQQPAPPQPAPAIPPQTPAQPVAPQPAAPPAPFVQPATNNAVIPPAPAVQPATNNAVIPPAPAVQPVTNNAVIPPTAPAAVPPAPAVPPAAPQPAAPPPPPVAPAPAVPPPPPVTPAPTAPPPPPVTAAPTASPPPPVATTVPPPALTPAPPAPGDGGQIQQCHLRSCDQTITGRRLSYSRALEIVQNEEYLSEADLSVIRRRKKRSIWRTALRKRREDMDAKRAVREFGRFGLESVDFDARESRQFPTPNGPDPAPAPTPTTTNNNPATPGDPVDNTPIGTTLLATGLIGLLGYTLLNTPPAPTLPPPPPPTLPPPTPAPTPPPRIPVSDPLPGTPGGGILPIGTSLVVLEALGLVPPGTTPVSVFPPFATPRTFNAVAVIFRENESTLTSPRRRKSFSAQHKSSLISRVRGGISSLSNRIASKILRRHKRGVSKLRRIGHPARFLASRFGNEIRRVKSTLARGWRRHSRAHRKESTHHHHQDNAIYYDDFLSSPSNEFHHQQPVYFTSPSNNIHHQEPVYHTDAFSSPSNDFHHQGTSGYHSDVGFTSSGNGHHNLYDQQSQFGEQIFEDELFGFRVRVRIVEDQPCALGVTCDDSGNKIGPNVFRRSDYSLRLLQWQREYKNSFIDRQTNEEFESDASPECRVVPNPNGCVPLK